MTLMFLDQSHESSRRRRCQTERGGRKILAGIWWAGELFGVAGIVQMIALVAEQIAILGSGGRCLVVAIRGRFPALGTARPAAIFICVKGDFEAAPVAVFHDTTFWFATFDLGAGR